MCWAAFSGQIPLLVGISLIFFAIIHFAPGGPLNVYTDNPSVSKEALEQIAKGIRSATSPFRFNTCCGSSPCSWVTRATPFEPDGPSWARFCFGFGQRSNSGG